MKPITPSASAILHPIRTEADYMAALAEVEVFFDMEQEPEPGTPEGDRFEILVTRIAAYEAQHYPIDPPDPVEAIKFRQANSPAPAPESHTAQTSPPLPPATR